MELVIGVIILIVVIALFCKAGRCDVCGLDIKKKYYTWEIDGRKQRLCPKCNAQMERGVSKEAFKKKFG
jgi:ribosome-binding protein aMBF1 (putative translation factor)